LKRERDVEDEHIAVDPKVQEEERDDVVGVERRALVGSKFALR